MHSFPLLMHHILISNLVSFNFFILFHGFEFENPYLHLREFEEACNTCTDQNCSMNIIRLKFFPFSLKDKAKTWLQNLRSESTRTWDEMQAQFLKKFFPPRRTNSFKRQITTFTKKSGETFYQCWDRLKNYLTFAHITVLKHGD